MDQASVLVIENDAEVTRHVVEIIQFMDLPARHFTTQGDWASVLDAKAPPYMVMLGNCGSAKSLLETFRKIKIADPYTPVVLLVDEDNAVPIDKNIESGALAKISLPLRRVTFDSALQKVDTYRENRHQGAAPRSLDSRSTSPTPGESRPPTSASGAPKAARSTPSVGAVGVARPAPE